jgi:hypothetical protein
MVSLREAVVSPGLCHGAFLGEAPFGLDLVALRAATSLWLTRNGPGADACGSD